MFCLVALSSVKTLILSGLNPFDNSQISGCPHCFSIDHFVLICDEPDCKSDATCGTPTDNGYRQTCGKHVPK